MVHGDRLMNGNVFLDEQEFIDRGAFEYWIKACFPRLMNGGRYGSIS